ncbi:uncharacterized protein [Setaria viridis]|uniref:uncharacterized protein n=1 Tax=Setaria viridis TaxID=4556 RepID=UPI003B3BB249
MGILNDVAVDCLVRVSHASRRALRWVCRGWWSTASAPSFATARRAWGRVVRAEARPVGQLGQARARVRWPAAAGRSAAADVGAGAGTAAADVGWGCGCDPRAFEFVADMHVLDAATGEWRRGAPLRSARSFFACAGAQGRHDARRI